MSNKEIFFDGKAKLYIKLPEIFEKNRVDFTISVPKTLEGKYLTILLAGENSTIPVRANCNEAECDNCHVVYCDVNQEYATLRNAEDDALEEDKGPTIPGHPNCHYGDCYDCHVVSCAIQQGWKEIPELPEKND